MTRWQVQSVTFDEFERGVLEGRPQVSVVQDTDDHEDAMRCWRDYYSGLCDYDGPHDGQKHGRATFYRVVEYDEANGAPKLRHMMD